MNDVGCSVSFDTPDIYAYLYNTRSELTNATATVEAAYRYGYAFDDIGNRKTSAERGEETSYFANPLNQYTNIEYSADQPSPVTAEHSGDGTSNLQPLYDADGNQTLVKTATGIWQVQYNGENRPVRWTQGDAVITMSFDRMGRRVTKNDQRFVYNGYLQIANFRSTTTTSDYNYFVWDCTENVATRPLAWKRGTSVAYYMHDGNKNVSEVVASDNNVTAHYEYAPFGALTISRGESAAANPWRFSSEYAEDDTATVYYNYRHYEPLTGRWMQRDPIEESSVVLLYGYSNRLNTDYLGMEELDLSYYADYAGWPILPWHPDYAMYVDMLSAVGEIGRFESEMDLQEKIRDRVGECDCIRLLRITAHGAAGDYDAARSDSKEVQMQLGSDSSLNEGYNLKNGVEMNAISEFFTYLKSKFCKKCTIRLVSCHLGENKYLAERIKTKTGCSVDVYAGRINPWSPPDALSLQYTPRMYAPSVIGGYYVY